jgi:hypothetical protein
MMVKPTLSAVERPQYEREEHTDHQIPDERLETFARERRVTALGATQGQPVSEHVADDVMNIVRRLLQWECARLVFVARLSDSR